MYTLIVIYGLKVAVILYKVYTVLYNYTFQTSVDDEMQKVIIKDVC